MAYEDLLVTVYCCLLTTAAAWSFSPSSHLSSGRFVRHNAISSLQGLPNENEVTQFGRDDDGDDYGKYDEETGNILSLDDHAAEDTSECDWIQGELTLLNAPTEPHPDLDAMQVATAICRSLQLVDYPNALHGLKRCYSFFTYDCRAAVTARQGAKSVEQFMEHGLLAPALQPFMGASRVNLGEATHTKASPPLRGALVSYPVVIKGAPIFSLQHPSGMERRTGIAASPPITNMVLRLEQQRRPPNQGCWMVREILDVRHAFAGDMGNAHVGG